MLLQVKRKFKNSSDKKGISIMIGYVLLITFAVIIGVVVYSWLKTYVPSDALECSEGVSIFLKDYSYDCTGGSEKLNLTLKNNGRFNIAGYFVRVNDAPNEELATIDLSEYTTAQKIGSAVALGNPTSNSFEPDSSPVTHVFDLSSSGIGNIYSIDIMPVRFQEYKGRERIVTCGDARIEEKISCEGAEEIPTGCGDGTCDSGECASGCTDDCDITECCGNGNCDAEIGETFGTCPGDCLQEIVQLSYFGFESGPQNWTDTGVNSDYSQIRSKVEDDETNGGIHSFHLQSEGPTSITAHNFNFIGYEEITIEWWGYYHSFENGDCVELKIDGTKVGGWGVSGCDSSVLENEWVLQQVVITNDQFNFDNSVEVRFEGEMSPIGWWDNFYVDGIKLTGLTE